MTERMDRPCSDLDATRAAVLAFSIDVAVLQAGVAAQADAVDTDEAHRRLMEDLGNQP